MQVSPETATKLLKLADDIEGCDNSAESEFGFDMSVFEEDAYETGHPCGTAACIAGWAQHTHPNEGIQIDGDFADWASIPYPDAEEICAPRSHNDPLKNPYSASPAQAAALLRHYVETGEVDWPRAMEVQS